MNYPTYSATQIQNWFTGYEHLLETVAEGSNSVFNDRDQQLSTIRWLDVAKNNHIRYPLLFAMFEFELAVALAAINKDEEAVPAEMLEMFSDEQWPELLVEFQATLALYSSDWPAPELRQQIIAGEALNLQKLKSPSATKRTWLVFAVDQETRIRLLEDEESLVMQAMINGDNVSLACQHIQNGIAMERLTNYLITWCQEHLIIDIGVPLPKDASFLPETE